MGLKKVELSEEQLEAGMFKEFVKFNLYSDFLQITRLIDD